jgi:hypothetical protein
MKKITLTNINEIIEASKLCCNEYHEKRINEGLKLFNEINLLAPACVEVNILDYENEKKSIYLEHFQIFLKHDFLKIQISFDEYRKKYNIFAHFDRLYKNVDHYQRREIEKTLTAPQNIGVLTAKKISAWVKHYEEINELLKAKNDVNNDKIEAFKKRLLGLTIPIKWYNDSKSGYVEDKEKGLIYTFEILESGYIKEDIRITKSNNLDTFLSLL